MKQMKTVAMAAVVAMMMLAGCGTDERLIQQAERFAERQSEQSRQVVELQHEVVSLQKEAQIGQNEIGRQRDELEQERKEIAARRHTEPIIANAIVYVGTLLACLLPLLICWQLLSLAKEPAEDRDVTELLLNDMMSEHPLLICSSTQPSARLANNTETEEDDDVTHRDG